MEIPNNLIDHIKKEAKQIRYGEITIVFNETNDKIDVISKNRERFIRPKNNSNEYKQG